MFQNYRRGQGNEDSQSCPEDQESAGAGAESGEDCGGAESDKREYGGDVDYFGDMGQSDEYRDAVQMPVVCVGAAFDIHAGTVSQAPPILQRFGLEWVFRLMHEPRRLWRTAVISS